MRIIGCDLQIIERDAYQRWLSKFGSGTKHLYINSTAAGGHPVMESSALIQARLNVIHPSIFPMHQYTSVPSPSGNELHDASTSSKGESSARISKVNAPEDDSQLNQKAWNLKKSNPLVGGGELTSLFSRK